MKPNVHFTERARRAINKYGFERCRRAFALSRMGNGARTIALEFLGKSGPGSTRAADAAIDAGREAYPHLYPVLT